MIHADKLSKKIYGEDYYNRCKEKGIDYAFYGNWQKQYAKMVVFVSEIYRVELANKTLLDIGTACGVNLKAFKETGVFSKVIGIDISEYLVGLGNAQHNFMEGELIVDDCRKMEKIENESIDFLHCSQLFEHLRYDDVKMTIENMHRVMKVGAIAYVTLNAIKKGQTEVDVTSQDETHVCVLHDYEWEKLFAERFSVRQDTERRMKKAMFYPGDDKSKNFYHNYYDDWSVFIFTK